MKTIYIKTAENSAKLTCAMTMWNLSEAKFTVLETSLLVYGEQYRLRQEGS